MSSQQADLSQQVFVGPQLLPQGVPSDLTPENARNAEDAEEGDFSVATSIAKRIGYVIKVGGSPLFIRSCRAW